MNFSDNDRLRHIIVLGAASLLGGVMFYKGRQLQSKPDTHSATVKGIVISARCTRTNNSLSLKRVRTVTTCDISFKYIVNGKEYVKSIESLRNSYYTNQGIDVRYNPNNPEDMTIEPSNENKGKSMIIAGLLLVIFAAVYWYITFKPKTI
jgi:hypothetical protein